MPSDGLQIPSLKDKVSADEWRVRVDLAAAYRLVAAFRWDDLVFTHISARVPGTDDQFLINPYGLMFDEITASSLVKIDLEGRKLDDSPFPVNPASPIVIQVLRYVGGPVVLYLPVATSPHFPTNFACGLLRNWLPCGWLG